MKDRIIHGDCAEVLKSIADESVDFVLTDPPYLTRYRPRSGLTVTNDDAKDGARVFAAYADIYRVMKPDTLCVSFYGWQAVDEFMRAWKAAGFVPVEHIVWKKSYVASSRFLNRTHEAAYVLAKGRPAVPSERLDDVQPWFYTGNRIHPTEKHVRILKPLIEAFTAPGDLVLDPFCGSGSTAVAAALLNRRYIGIEIEEKYVRLAQKRLAGVARRRNAA
jgi:DNA modification methylase